MTSAASCSRLAAWGTAYLRGATSLDDAAAAVSPSRVSGMPGCPDAEAVIVVLGRLRAAGTRGLRLALPAPGDPLGLSGPAPFNALATDARGAVLTVGGPALGFLQDGDLWQVHAVTEPAVLDVPSLAGAEQELAEAVRDATVVLSRLDVARSDARVPGLLAAADRSPCLAPGYPGRAHRVLAQSQRLLAVVAVALSSDGGAVTAAEATERARALRPVERAARRAAVAAHAVVLTPEHRASA